MRPIQCQPGPAFLRASIALAAGCFISAAVEAATIDFNGLQEIKTVAMVLLVVHRSQAIRNLVSQSRPCRAAGW